MAEGNPYYLPRPSFFEEFSKGVGLGLSLRQASDRAKQLELQTQQQQMAMEEMKRQRGIEDTLRTYANTETPGALNEPLTSAAQANQQITNDPTLKTDITGVQGVYEAPGGKPTLAQIVEQGARLGARPEYLKAIEGAITATRGQEPPRFFPIPGGGMAVQGDKIHVVNQGGSATNSLSGMRAAIIAAEAGLPSPLDTPEKIAAAKKSLISTLQIPNSPDAIAYTSLLREAEAQRAAGGLSPDEASKSNEMIAYDRLTGAKTQRSEQQAQAQQRGALTVKQSEAFLQNQEDINYRRELGTKAGQPLDSATARRLSIMESANRQAQIVLQNYDESFLGPVKGTERMYELRRRVGSYVNSPIGEKEERFRGALARMQEEFARAKEGGVIPPEMYNRLIALVGTPASEPTAFKSTFNRFVEELSQDIKTTTRFGIESRRDLANQSRERQPSQQEPRFEIDVRPGSVPSDSKDRKTIQGLDGKTYNIPKSTTPSQLKQIQDALKAGAAGAATAPRPRAVNSTTGEVVEWDGKEWVKVK